MDMDRVDAFRLPTSVTILIISTPEKVVAHNLDFDLVAVGTNQDEAEDLLEACTKEYVECGLRGELAGPIHRPAPLELWEKVWCSEAGGRSRTISIDSPEEPERDSSVPFLPAYVLMNAYAVGEAAV